MLELEKLQENIAKIRTQIDEVATKVNRKSKDIELIVVTKSVTTDTIKKLSLLGEKNIGENRIQSAKDKHSALQDTSFVWHMIGHLQSNKVKQALTIFDFFHSVDRIKIAQELSCHANKVIPILLQVNISKEDSKHGFWEEQIWDCIPEIVRLENLQIKGLMMMAPFTDDMALCKKYFKNTRILAEKLRDKGYIEEEVIQLSMGMSGDFQVAIEEGATMIRVGSAIFS